MEAVGRDPGGKGRVEAVGRHPGGKGRVEAVGRDPGESWGQGWWPRVSCTQVTTHLTIMQGRSQGKQASMQTDKHHHRVGTRSTCQQEINTG